MKVIKFASVACITMVVATACSDKPAADGAEAVSQPVVESAAADPQKSESFDFKVGEVGYDLPGSYKIVYDRSEAQDAAEVRKLFVESLDRKYPEVKADLLSAAQEKGCSLAREVPGESRIRFEFSCPTGRFVALVRPKNQKGEAVSEEAKGVIQISHRIGG